MEEKRIRISDIAEELGLSTATVSNVLHGKTKKVSDKTVQRVQALLEERQYIPSMAGILLAQNDSRIIGVVVNDHKKYEGHPLEDVFISASLNCLSTEIEKNGQFMMIKKITDPEAIIRFGSMWNLDGLVLIGFCNEDYVYLRNHMRIPFVVYDGYMIEDKRICNIVINHYDGGVQMGRYFKERGYEHVLCIADNEVCMDKERYDGFRHGFGGSGADFLKIPMQKNERRKFYQDHINRIKEYSAIFAVSDFYAIELMQFLKEQGICVPEEIAVAGFDDTPMCCMVAPMLTSIRQDVEVRTKIALEKLRDLKAKKETETTVTLPVSLVVRDSTEYHKD